MIQRMNATTKAAIWYKLTGSTAVQPGAEKSDGKIDTGTDQSFTGYGDTVSLEYKWQGNNHLTVTQLFNGGQDTISFETDGQGTRLLQNTVRINYPAKLLVLVTLN